MIILHEVSGFEIEEIIRFDIVKTEFQSIYSVFLCFLMLTDLAHSVDWPTRLKKDSLHVHKECPVGYRTHNGDQWCHCYDVGSSYNVNVYDFMLTYENYWEVIEMCFWVANCPVEVQVNVMK